MSITPMPTSLRFVTLFLFRFALVVAAVTGIGSAQAFGMVLTEESVDVIAVAPVSEDARLAGLLAKTVGGVAASSPVGKPEGQSALVAHTLSAKASASRSYGSVRVSAFRMADESLAYAMLRFLRPEDAAVTPAGDDGWVTAKQSAVRLGDIVILVSGGSDGQRSA
ncbi:MAG: hypothetical protein WBQ66_20990, partial [Blastocatellia bacterium]